MLASRLGVERFEIHRSPDLDSAADTLRRLRPDIAVVALVAPGLGTRSIIDPLRAVIADLPIIVLSAGDPGVADQDVIALELDTPTLVLRDSVFRLLDHPSGSTGAMRLRA